MFNDEPVYRIDVDDDGGPISTGAVLKFGTHDIERVQRFLDTLYERGIISEPATAHEYEPNYGGPVWYVP